MFLAVRRDQLHQWYLHMEMEHGNKLPLIDLVSTMYLIIASTSPKHKLIIC